MCESARYLAYKKYYLLALANKEINIFTNTNKNVYGNKLREHKAHLVLGLKVMHVLTQICVTKSYCFDEVKIQLNDNTKPTAFEWK